MRVRKINTAALPGPAFTALGSGDNAAQTFVAAVLIGMGVAS